MVATIPYQCNIWYGCMLLLLCEMVAVVSNDFMLEYMLSRQLRSIVPVVCMYPNLVGHYLLALMRLAFFEKIMPISTNVRPFKHSCEFVTPKLPLEAAYLLVTKVR
jgi:hypothetical protein